VDCRTVEEAVVWLYREGRTALTPVRHHGTECARRALGLELEQATAESLCGQVFTAQSTFCGPSVRQIRAGGPSETHLPMIRCRSPLRAKCHQLGGTEHLRRGSLAPNPLHVQHDRAGGSATGRALSLACATATECQPALTGVHDTPSARNAPAATRLRAPTGVADVVNGRNRR
jgi:hypothetical protein